MPNDAFHFDATGYDGTQFGDLHVRRDSSSGPGWFIFGRDARKYGVNEKGEGVYVLLCGYRFRRHHVHYNGPVRHGWRTKRDALAALATRY